MNLLVLAALATFAYAASEVQLGTTTLVGRDIPSLGLEFFGGIPYASPPLGELRLQPPVLQTRVEAENGTFDARNFGFTCLQPGVPLELLSEDCLTINIFRPAGLSRDVRLPVMFWTYGGGFQGGSSAEFNASVLVAQSVSRGTPVVYVSFNYRLGPLGFPQGQEVKDAGVENLGIRDQIAALRWVQANIRIFGGDPDKVTAFGVSAGAIMTATLVLDSTIKGLARAAILESGSAATAPAFDANGRVPPWQSFVAGVPQCASSGANVLDCLRRNATSEGIIAGISAAFTNPTSIVAWAPSIDGEGGVFRDYPSKLLAKGEFAKIPYISGTVLDEGPLFVPRSPSLDYTREVVETFITSNYSPSIVSPARLAERTDRVISLYPDVPALGSPFNTGNETFGLDGGFKRLAAIVGDLTFQATRRLWMRGATEQGVKAYGYLFTQPQPGTGALGVTHGSEVKYVYGSPLLTNSSGSDVVLSRMIMDYWISFASSLDPNDGRGVERPLWRQYKPGNQVLLELNGGNTRLIRDNYREKQIAAINADPLVFLHRRQL